MCGRGHATSGIPLHLVLGATRRVITGGVDLVASIFFAVVAAVVAFSNAKFVRPAVGTLDPKLLMAASR